MQKSDIFVCDVPNVNYECWCNAEVEENIEIWILESDNDNIENRDFCDSLNIKKS